MRSSRRVAIVGVAVPLLAALAACSTSHGGVIRASAVRELPAQTLGAAAASATATPANPGLHVGAPAPRPAGTPGRTGVSHPVGGCSIFPADNVWHAKASGLPLDARSAAYVKSIGTTSKVHPDFGSGTYDGAPFGIPITTVPAGQAKVHVTFDYASESDKGPYPIPSGALIEGGAGASGDRHVILLDRSACRAYELFDAHHTGSIWTAGSGAIFDLRSNALRPKGWTSADAAGLPIISGLVQYDEVESGVITHAIRMTAPRTRSSYVWPARHAASDSSSLSLPPMGQRFRLKASVSISGMPKQARVVAQALKTYGAILADNGSSWYLSGTQDSRWDNDALHALGSLPGSDFEAVDSSGLMVSSSSGATR